MKRPFGNLDPEFWADQVALWRALGPIFRSECPKQQPGAQWSAFRGVATLLVNLRAVPRGCYDCYPLEPVGTKTQAGVFLCLASTCGGPSNRSERWLHANGLAIIHIYSASLVARLNGKRWTSIKWKMVVVWSWSGVKEKGKGGEEEEQNSALETRNLAEQVEDFISSRCGGLRARGDRIGCSEEEWKL